MLFKKGAPPGDPIGDKGETNKKDTSKHWMVILALGTHSDDAFELGRKSAAEGSSIIKYVSSDRAIDAKTSKECIGGLLSDLMKDIDKFFADEGNDDVKAVIDIHVCGPMNICTALGIYIEKIRHQVFNEYDVAISIGEVSCYDRQVSGKMTIALGDLQ